MFLGERASPGNPRAIGPGLACRGPSVLEVTPLPSPSLMKNLFRCSDLLRLGLLATALARGLPSEAATIQWTNRVGGSWSGPTNWSPNVVPGPSDNAVIAAGGTYTVTADTGPTVASLSIGAADGTQTLDLGGTTVVLAAASTVGERGILMGNGTLQQLEGTLTIRGRWHWLGGLVRGSVVVASGGVVTIETAADHTLAGTLTNQSGGTLRWSGGRFFLDNGSTLVNQNGALIDKQSDDGLHERGDGPNRFVNQGVLRKSGGTFSAPVGVEFLHQGTAEILSGGLLFPRGFTSRGLITVAEAARLELGGGVFVLEPGHGFGGAGFYGVEGGDITVVGDLVAPNFQLRNGTLTGTNRLTGTLAWLSGHLRGQHTVANGGLLRIESGGDHVLQGTLTNQSGGTLRWSGGRFFLDNGSTLLNQAGGLFDKLSDEGLQESGAGPNRFVNQGVFRKSGGAFSAPIQVPTHNEGTIDLLSGVLSFPPGYTQTVGTTRLSGGSLATGDPILLQGGSLTGTGTVSGPLVNSAQVNPGSGPGTLRIEGNYTQTSTGVLNLDLAGLAPEAQDLLVVSGRAQLDGRLVTTLSGGFVPPSNRTFVVVTAGTREGTFARHQYPSNLVGLELIYLVDSVSLKVLSSALESDKTGPRVLSVTPSGVVSNAVDHLDVTLDSPIDPATFAPADVDLRGPSGSVPVTIRALGGNTNRLTFPSLAPGEYTLRIGPDILDLAANPMNQDGDTSNGEPDQDAFTSSFSVRLPDLRVHAIAAPSDTLIGQPLALVWVVTNRGNAIAQAPWTDHLALADRAAGAAEIHLAAATFTNSLPPGMSLVRTQSVIVPSGIVGPRVVVVRTDAANDIEEGPNETNNALDDDQPIQIRAPDLQVRSVTAPASATFGQSIQVTWTTWNAGTGPALAAWEDGVFLGPDATSLASAIPLLSVPVPDAAPLPKGSSYTRTRAVTLPLDAGLAPGNYFLWIAADASDAQSESDDGNNLAARPLAITPAPLPDLAI